MVPAKVPEKWHYEADIIVVGGGTAGLPAAITAADAGAKVAVLEIVPYCGGSLSLINVGPAFAGTDVQKELGIDDSPEKFYEEGLAFSQGDPELWKTYTDNQLEIYNWCQAMGMNFGKNLMMGPGHKTTRIIWKKGAEMTRILEKTAKEKGVDIKFLHRAVRLITDQMTGRVLGLKVKVKNKEEQNFKAKKAVILATGGFGRNREMVEEYGPEFVDWLPTMGAGHLGDGLKMALDVGAATKDLGRAVSGSFAVDIETKSAIIDFVGFAGGIYVNVNGKRFVDEACRLIFYGQVTEEGMKQPGKVWFAIYDDKMKNTTLEAHMLKKAKPQQFDRIEELARTMGIDPVGLKETIDKYNRDIDTVGYDTVFDRRTLISTSGTPPKIDATPFYVLKCTGATSSLKGGLKINAKAQVVTQYGEIIPNLYAAGEVTGGLWGAHGAYVGAVMVPQSMTFGRIAAKNAVEEPSL